MKLSRFAAIAAALIAMVFSSGCGSTGTVIKTGNIGVRINHLSGNIDKTILHAGWNPQLPLSGYEVLEIPTYQRTYTMVKDDKEGLHEGDDSIVVNTASSNTLNVDTSITYHINYDPIHPEEIINLYNKYRNQFNDDKFATFEDKVLRGSFRQSIADAFGLKTTSDDMSGDGKRQAASYALKQLNDHFNKDSIVIDEVRIRAVYPDTATQTAMKSRLQAQQNLRIAQLNQTLQNLVNQKNIEAAQGESTAAHIRAASLTPRLVKFKHIKDLDIIGVPNGAIVNLNDSPAGDAKQ